ncbi:MAG: ABC transporter ATP-binding protein [Anaerolineae bacterium]|nr:ABC transporter ATP-binding protein [Anaerolineae bacterium]
MSNFAINAFNISKNYKLGTLRHDTLRDQITYGVKALLGTNGRSKEGSIDNDHFWAIKGVSFDVSHGEVVGIIGRNGAGKSTLLKILSRITEPTTGKIEIYGRVGSLLEVGTGFHPELSGRENIYLNGSILGMTRQEINSKFDEIVTFSEIEKFLDTPVKRYSSGMYVRLAFAVAAHLEPEILIVDEVLAVGDVSFQEKCLKKMDDVSKTGRTVLFVSHNMAAVQNLCQRVILLENGEIKLNGPADETIRNYLSGLHEQDQDPFKDNPNRQGDGRIRLVGVRAVDESNQPTKHLVAGKPVSFEFHYRNIERVKIAEGTFTIYNQFGVPVANFDMNLTNFMVDHLVEEGKFICHIPNLPLPVGQYRIDVGIHINRTYADSIPNALIFDVSSSVFHNTPHTPKIKYGSCLVEHTWQHKSNQS